MNRKTLISVLVVSGFLMTIFSACIKSGPQLPEWLEGTWTTGDSIGLTAETWEKINDQYISGEGLFTTSDGKFIVEMLNIFIQEGTLVYTALVPGENTGQEIIFIDTNLNPDSLVFKNPKHNYPKKIIYFRENPEKINVYLFGSNEKPDKIITLNKVIE
jgi:hypothetical protein